MGAAPAKIEVERVAFWWVGTLAWGHEPWGADPIAWSCARCGDLVVDVKTHARHHGMTDTKEE
jgi:hypothetical protein